MKIYNTLKKQQGFSLVAVIFLITVLAIAVVFIQRISNVAVASNNLAMEGARAWQAAKAGSEWGIYQVTHGGCPTSPISLVLTEQSLNNFKITVTCSSNNYTEGSVVVNLFQLEVLAESGNLGATQEYVSRKISLTVES